MKKAEPFIFPSGNCLKCQQERFQKTTLSEIPLRQCIQCGCAYFSKSSLVERGIHFQPSSSALGKTNPPACPKCTVPMNRVKTNLSEDAYSCCESCDLIWSEHKPLDPIFEYLYAHPARAEKIRPIVKGVAALLFVIAGLIGTFYFTYGLSGDFTQALIVTGCLGLPSFYVVHLAIQGKVVTLAGRDIDGDPHADIESVGTAFADMWQESRGWILGFIVACSIAIGLLFLLPLPRAQLYRYLGWLQKPYSTYLDVMDSKDKPALGRMCDWYLKAWKTEQRTFSTTQVDEVKAICKSAGPEFFEKQRSTMGRLHGP